MDLVLCLTSQDVKHLINVELDDFDHGAEMNSYNKEKRFCSAYNIEGKYGEKNSDLLFSRMLN